MGEARSNPVRLLTVCGSLQHRSANRSALAVARSVAGELGAVVDDFGGLAAVPAFNPELEAELLVPVDAWRAQVAAADAVLLAAPEYAGALAGAIKNALDWLVGTAELYRKPVAVLSAGTTGGHHALRMLAQTTTWQGSYVVAELGIASPRTKVGAAGDVTDPTTLEAIAELTRTLLAAATMPSSELVAQATRVVGSLGIDVGHVVPAA